MKKLFSFLLILPILAISQTKVIGTSGSIVTIQPIGTSGSATDLSTGTLPAGRMPAFSGDFTTSAGSTAATIAAGAITYAKMQNISATSRLLGRNSAGAGVTEEVTASQVLDWLGSATQGTILYRNGTTWVYLSPGTNGQVLTTAGAGANPSWGNISVTNAVSVLSDANYTVTTNDLILQCGAFTTGRTLTFPNTPVTGKIYTLTAVPNQTITLAGGTFKDRTYSTITTVNVGCTFYFDGTNYIMY